MPRIAVCSWSLQPRDAAELVERVRACGLDSVQLALDPVRTGIIDADVLYRQDIRIVSGMMAMAGEDYSTLESIRRTGGLVPDEHFAMNLEAAHTNAQLARELGLRLVTFHAGFIPDEPGARRTQLVERLARVRDAFAAEAVAIALETGQESAESLIAFLDEVGGDVGVNFDPANMILYGMGDPVAALEQLAPRVRQVHVKDARASQSPGQWGVEVPVGEGEVDWRAFFAAVPADVALVIEREAGDDRIGDVRRALSLIRAHAAA